MGRYRRLMLRRRNNRREFLKSGATLSVASLGIGLVGACGGSPQTGSGAAESGGGSAGGAGGAGGDGGSAGTGGGAAGDVGATGGAGGSLSATPCDVTAPNILGPFHSPGSPERQILWDDDPAGQRLIVTGRVFGVDCAIVSGATLDFWEAKTDGLYDNEGYTLRGHQFADSEGSYELKAIIPGRYLNGSQYRPQHIHVIVTAPGYAPLTTQLYFEGDPYNEIDPFIIDSLIMKTQERDGVTTATFDFVLELADD